MDKRQSYSLFGDPAAALWRGLHLLGEGLWWMALGALPQLCRPSSAQVGGPLQRLFLVLGLGPREPAPEVSWPLPGGGGRAQHERLGA